MNKQKNIGKMLNNKCPALKMLSLVTNMWTRVINLLTQLSTANGIRNS